jgi:hypothetical protein
MSSKLQMKFTTNTFQNKLQYQNNFYIKIPQKIVFGSVFCYSLLNMHKNDNLLAANSSKYKKIQHSTINHWLSQSQLPAGRLQTLLSILHLAAGSE